MDKKKVIDILNTIAEDEIPGNVDLWPTLHTRLGTSTTQIKSYGRWPATRLGRVGLTVIMLLLFSSVAYAIGPVLRQLFNTDPGLQHVEETDLVQPLHLSQTIEGITVTVEQAYADASRVVVGYTLKAPDFRQFQPHNISLTQLPDTDLPPTIGFGDGTDGYNLSFDTTSIQGAPRQLNLQLVMYAEEFVYSPEFTKLLKQFGSVEKIPEEKRTKQLSSPTKGGSVGPFVFDFSIPFLPRQTLSIQQVVEATGAWVRLEEIEIAPSETQATVCVTPPANGDAFSEWIPITSLDTGQGVPISNGASYMLRQTEQEFCHRLIFPYPLTDQPGQWTVTVTEVVGFSNEDYNKQMRLSGPWVFQFDVP